MSVSRIAELAPPPEHPKNAPTQEQWQEYEKNLGITLPEDYKRFISTFGSGTLKADNLRLQVYSPQSNEFDTDAEYLSEQATDYFAEVWPDGDAPYKLSPGEKSLLGIAMDDTKCLYYVADGPPETWSIFGFALRGGEWHEKFGGPLSEFILKLLENRLESTTLYREPVVDDPESIKFDSCE